MANDSRGPALVDLWWVIGLSAIAIGVITAWDKVKAMRSAPIALTSKLTGKNFTIAIPEFVIPRKAGETPDSVKSAYKPTITRDGLEWVVTVPKVSYDRGGIILDYTPPPVRVPIVPSMNMITLALKLTPTVIPVSEPPGWKVKFPVITLAA